MSIIIETGKKLILENVISLRKKILQNGVNEEIEKITNYLDNNELKRNGPIMTTVYELSENGVIDMEILVPINKSVNLPSEYRMIPLFRLTNALYSRHKGDISLLQNVYNSMTEYIQSNELQQITTVYNVTINEVSSQTNIDELIIDVYIGLSDNLL